MQTISRFLPLFAGGLVFSLFCGQSASAEDDDAKADRAKKKIMQQLERSMGRLPDGIVVYAFYVMTEQKNKDGSPVIEVKVQSTEGRATAAEHVFNFMSTGEGWSGAPVAKKEEEAAEQKPAAAEMRSPQGARNFRYLKSFKAEEATAAAEFATQADAYLKQEIVNASKQAQAYQDYMKQMQQQMQRFRSGGGSGNRGGGYPRPR